MSGILRAGLAAFAAATALHTAASAQATGAEAAQAAAACEAAAAAHYRVEADAIAATVRSQRTGARVIKLELELDRGDGARHRASCVVNRKTGEVKSFEARS